MNFVIKKNEKSLPKMTKIHPIGMRMCTFVYSTNSKDVIVNKSAQQSPELKY